MTDGQSSLQSGDPGQTQNQVEMWLEMSFAGERYSTIASPREKWRMKLEKVFYSSGLIMVNDDDDDDDAGEEGEDL